MPPVNTAPAIMWTSSYGSTVAPPVLLWQFPEKHGKSGRDCPPSPGNVPTRIFTKPHIVTIAANPMSPDSTNFAPSLRFSSLAPPAMKYVYTPQINTRNATANTNGTTTVFMSPMMELERFCIGATLSDPAPAACARTGAMRSRQENAMSDRIIDIY